MTITPGSHMARYYQDKRIEVGSSGVSIKGYYLPWGTKHVAYGSISSLKRVDIGTFTGRGRIWGTANPKYWANFDASRPKKTIGFVFDLNKAVSPFVTPDDPDAFEAAIRSHVTIPPDEGSRSGPII